MQTEDPFDTFQNIAFRVEALPDYPDEDGGHSEIEHFRTHGNAPADHNEIWVQMIKRAVNRGGQVERLRVVSSPLSPYEDFEVHAGYQAGINAGERIKIYSGPDLQIPYDFWVYDWETIEILHYDETGRFIDSEVRPITPKELVTAKRLHDVFEAIPETLAP